MSTTTFYNISDYNCIMLSYEPLWKTLKEQNISQYQLINSGIDRKTMDSLRHNRNITAITIEKLCRILNCSPNDILEFVDDAEPPK